MPRIEPVDPNTADPATAELLNSVKKSMGGVPNLVATMAHSPAVARAYLGFAQAIAGDGLPRRLREQIALVVGEANACGYCVAAHTALGRRAGLTEEDEDVDRLRRAGYTEGEVGEIVANVALNLFTNYFNHVAATELDFPAAPDLAA